ncbi:DUF4822 domain-containing protein [Myroides sp. LJL110]
MKKTFLKLFFVLGVVLTSMLITSCTNDPNFNAPGMDKTASEILSSHVWITTKIVDNNGNDISLDSLAGAMYAGYAYYKADGTFRIIDFNDNSKIFGLWEIKDNPIKRYLAVYDSNNEIIYKDSVDLLELTNNKFTFEIADSIDPLIKYNVEHQPVTDHPEPKTASELLAAVEWETTKVLDITNGIDSAKELDKSVPPALNLSGDAYYLDNNPGKYFPKNDEGKYANGTFLITEHGDNTKVKYQGDWYVSLDGKQRTLLGRNQDGAIDFESIVSIVELTQDVFTYDIKVDELLLRVEHKPIEKKD